MADSRPRFRRGFAVLGLIVVGLAAWAIFGGKKPAKAQKPPAVPVSTARATAEDVPLSITALGAAQPWSSVTIHAQVNGKLLSVDFHEGSDVRAGQQLAQIDPAPYQAALEQAEGALKRDTALLGDARLDLKRYQTLAAQDSIARQQLDTQAALVKQDEGVVLLDQGQVDTARINLGYCKILSPTTGRAGVRLVDAGNLVSTTDTTGLVIIDQIAPIAVTFTVPQGDFERLVQVSDGFKRPLPTEALSQETGAPLDTGALSIADNHVDPTTGTVQLKARFPNGAKLLWPGQFVNVKLTLQTLSHAVAIPATAINQGPSGVYVYVVGPDHKVSMRPVTVAATQDTTAVIKSGVKLGETVVTDGQMSLRPGSLVASHPSTSGKKPSA